MELQPTLIENKFKENWDSSNFKGMCRMMGSDFKDISEMLTFRMCVVRIQEEKKILEMMCWQNEEAFNGD